MGRCSVWGGRVLASLLLLIAASRFDAGLSLYREGRLTAALEEFNASERAGEDRPTRGFYQGVCQAKLGRLAEAQPRLLAYVAAQPADPNGWFWLSRTQLLQKQFPEARKSIQRAIDLAPGSFEALRTQGEIELELRNHDAAYRAWMAANKLNSKDAQTTYYLGRLFYEADLPNEAAAWLRETLRLAPTHFSAMTYLALCAEQLPDNQTALRLYREAIRQSKLQKAPYSWAYLSYAKLLRQMGNDKEALAVLEEAGQLCPEAHALALLGSMLAARDQTARAEAVLRRAIEMDPNISEAHYRLSLLLQTSGRGAEAQRETERFKAAKEAEEQTRSKVSAIRK